MRKLAGIPATLLVTALLAVLLVVAAPSASAAPPPPPLPAPTGGCLDIMALLCNLPAKTVGAASTAIDFVTNPIGYLAAGFATLASDTLARVELLANDAAAPDLTASWWLDAYRKGLAIGVVLLGFVLLYEIVQVARRKTSGDELLETLSTWIPAWFAGVIFGPPLAQFIITGVGFLSNGITHSMTGYGAGDAFAAVTKAMADSPQVEQTGQLLMALIMAVFVFIAAFCVFVSLCLQAVIVYMAAAVFAIGWVWITTQRQRGTAWRIPRLILGILFSKPLLFFLLGVAMAIAQAATAFGGDNLGKNLALLVMAIAAMLMAAFTPLILLKHAPVIPGTATSRHVGDAGAAAGAGSRSAARTGKTGVAGASRLTALAARSGGRGQGGVKLGEGARATWSDLPGSAPSGTSRAGRPAATGGQASAGTGTASAGARPASGPRPGRPASAARNGPRSTGGGAAPSRRGPAGPRTSRPQPAPAMAVPDSEYIPPTEAPEEGA